MKSSKRQIYLSLQTKLLFIFLTAAILIFGMNLYMYFNINKIIFNIDKVYESNATLNALQSGLTQVHRNMESFLDTENTEALEGYLKSEQEYREQLEGLNDRILGDAGMIAQKNIRGMSERYIEITDKAVEAKRGRNIAKYKEFYEQGMELYGFINSYIYSLNNEQFLNNSKNYKILFASLKYLETVNLVILCLISALDVILIVFLTRGIINPLKRLAEAAGEVADGNLNIELSDRGPRDEVGTVTRSFNQMVESLKSHIAQLKASLELESAMKEKQLMMEAHLKDAQLKYLQAQINPHFLFNTLNAGAQLAMMEGADRTYLYVQNVADFFRYNVKKNNDVVTLREEIELVDNYIYIINVRFSGDVHFHKNIEENLVCVQVPSMILQPIVENCINHGMRGIEWENRIELSVCSEGDGICVRIRDNGVGIGRDKIGRILHGGLMEKERMENSGGVGLDNVISRLRLFFEKEDVIEITSEGENLGTEVAIHIPAGE